MSRLSVAAELTKLARLLGTQEHRLTVFADLGPQELRALRWALSDTLHRGDRERFGRLVAASRLMPNKLIALIAEKVMGPMLSARMTGLMEVATAVDVARRLPAGFLADLCIEMDPRSAVGVLRAIPQSIVVAVALELLARREYLTMARFVDVVADEVVQVVVRRIADDAVLRVGVYVESAQRLGELIEAFNDTRLTAIIHAAARDPEQLWSLSLAVMEAVDARTRMRMAKLLFAGDEAQVRSLLEQVEAKELWDALAWVLASTSETLQRRLAHAAYWGDAARVSALFQAARRRRCDAQLQALRDALPEPLRAQLSFTGGD